jgi:hypothetical protein
VRDATPARRRIRAAARSRSHRAVVLRASAVTPTDTTRKATAIVVSSHIPAPPLMRPGRFRHPDVRCDLSTVPPTRAGGKDEPDGRT